MKLIVDVSFREKYLFTFKNRIKNIGQILLEKFGRPLEKKIEKACIGGKNLVFSYKINLLCTQNNSK